ESITLFITTFVYCCSAVPRDLHSFPTRRSSDLWKTAAVTGFLLLFAGNGGVSWAEQIVPSGITALLVTMVTSNAVIPEGTICSAQLTPPFPANSSRKPVTAAVFQRSEERRVGKECRSRGTAEQQ